MKRIIAWLPDSVDTRLKVIGWVYLVGQIILIGTGGLVRLTSSGLGCPTWPKCTDDSLINTPEMGIHGVIEFGNRLLGVVLGLIAIIAFLMVLKLRRSRPEFFWLTLLAGLGIPAQAVIGGISVLTDLNPYVVGLHFVISTVLVALCAAFLLRLYAVPGPRARAVPAWFAGLAHLTSLVVAVTILVGILTTGSGPHSGDTKATRNGLNPEILQHVHAIPAYVTFGLTLVLVLASLRIRTTPVHRYTMYLLAVEVLQIAVGLIQADTGLPGILVDIHMMLAALLAAAMTAVIMSLKAPVATGDSRQGSTVSGAVAA